MKSFIRYFFSFRKPEIRYSSSLSALAWRKFKKNKLAVSALVYIGICVLISLLGYTVTPDSTPLANEQFLELTTLKPGSKVNMLCINKNEKDDDVSFFSKMLKGEKSNYRKIPFSDYHFDKDQVIIEEFADTTVKDRRHYGFKIPDVIYALDPENKAITLKPDSLFFSDIDGNQHAKSLHKLRQELTENNIRTKTFLLGSDRFGRDMLSRLMIGTRVSLSVGFISVFISLFIGITLGAIAGFFRGRIDDFIVWLINVVWSLPTLLLVIAITFALGKGFWQVFVAVGITMWVEVARVVRGQIISLREKEFIEAGKALGYTNSRIIFRHIIPNIMSPVIVISAANFAAAILIEAGLSFLGIGVQPPMPSWGSMIKEHYGYLILDSAYLAILPGIAIVLMVLAFMLIGNALRDALDVKT